ncbi:hypothetical protein CP8484711_0521B, partial [Chlamydia psittaci 84-8471/1]
FSLRISSINAVPSL